MGLSNFPSPAEGVLPVLVMNTVLSVTILKNMVRSMLHVVGATSNSYLEEDSSSSSSLILSNDEISESVEARNRRRISITRYESLCKTRCNDDNNDNNNISKSVDMLTRTTTLMECCVCLCRFEDEEEVSELSCKHFFHKCCLEKWFDNKHTTCPLCRSIM